ncbi:hypothetical protein [Nonlabens spongiae]|uniref:hypothetical protein n=1 Tax=Nonlabens spongiae TaxID=331648 RepID=UPI0012F4E7A9|nr:hypothetical protein [Nonlabens spongiae]
MGKYLVYITFLSLVVSCKSDKEIEQAAQQQADQDFSQIDLERVNRYPLFENCDEMEPTPDCFYRELHKLVALRLKDEVYDFKFASRDSIIASITVTATGQLKYDSLVNTSQNRDYKELDSMLREKLYPLCKIEPAILQDVPVSTTYLLPIKISPAPQAD